MKEINVQPNSRYQLKIDVSNTIDTSLIAQAGFIVWGEDGLFTSEPLIQLEGLIGNFDGTHTLSFTTDAATNNIVLQVFMMLNDSTQNNLYFTINNVTLEEINGGEIYTINPHSSLNKYRYGWNGMEKEPSIGIGGYDFGARIYNSLLGRWLTRDNLEHIYPSISTYTYVANNPIMFVDIGGDKIGVRYFDSKVKDRFVRLLNDNFIAVGKIFDVQANQLTLKTLTATQLKKLTKYQINTYNYFKDRIKDDKEATINLIDASDQVSLYTKFGDFDRANVDIGDIENVSLKIPAINIIFHEIEEQWNKQVKGLSDFDEAHNSTLSVEAKITGIKWDNERNNGEYIVENSRGNKGEIGERYNPYETGITYRIDILNEKDEYLKTVQFTIKKDGTISNTIEMTKDDKTYNNGFESTAKPN